MGIRAFGVWTGLWVSAVLTCALCDVTYGAPRPSANPISVAPKTDAADLPSPPALPDEKRSPEPPVPGASEPVTTFNLTVEAAIVMALEHNHSLLVEEVNPAIRQTQITQQRAAFDPALVGGFTRTDSRLERDLRVTTTTGIPDVFGTGDLKIKEPVQTNTDTRTDDLTIGVKEHLPTGGDVSLTLGKTQVKTRNTTSNLNLARSIDTDSDSPNLSLTVTQSILKGAGLGVNLASLRQARIGRLSSDYELRGVAESLVSRVEQTYWDFVLAQRKIAIYEQSVLVAQTQLDEVQVRIDVGKLAESERAAAEAEIAQRKSSLIDARSTLATTRLALLRLLNPSDDALRGAEVNPLSDPSTPDIPLAGTDDSVALAKRMRPDLNQARLLIKSDELELVKTKNGLLPQLDLFLTLSKDVNETSYAQSFLVSTEDRKNTGYASQVGATFSYPIGNRAAHATHTRAKLTREQNFRALANMAQLVEQDVRSAYIEVGRAHEQIAATAATKRLQDETLMSETEKFRVGRSTVLLVAQAQRDLLTAQINEVQAKAAYLKAVVALYQLEGSLLERRGVQCPGR